MEKLRKLITMIMVVVMTIGNMPIAVLAEEKNSERDIVTSVTYGDLDEEGHIQIKKTVTPTDTLGRYKVSFEIQGVPVNHTSPLYAVVVFDRSGSMICNPSTGHSDLKSEDPHFVAADSQGIVCKNDSNNRENSNLLTTDKWNNAIAGAKSFQTTLKNSLGDNAHISLVTFSSNAATATEDFSDSSFGHPYGATNLKEAIDTAKNKINSDSQGVANAKKIILVISDGEPTEPSWFADPKAAATNSATSAKNSGIEIYAIGYATDSTTSKYLKENISSYKASNANDKHYSDADPDTVSSAVNSMVSELLAAGTNPSLQDTATTQFTINGDAFGGGTRSFTLNNITAEKQTIEFYIDIDKSTESGIYDTNNTTNSKAVLSYTDSNGQSKQIVLDKSPNVLWERPKYNYIVKYYKDEVNDNNFLGQTTPTLAEYSTTVADKVNVDLKKPDGYKSGVIQNPELTISDDEEQNVINVVYSKKDNLIYKVNYNYADIAGLPSISHSEIVNNQTFGSIIKHSDMETLANTDLASHPGYVISSITPQGDLTIADEENENELSNNIININYIPRADLSYIVKHNYEGHPELLVVDQAITATFGDVITNITQQNRYGYTYDYKDPESLRIGVGENIINAYYRKVNNLTFKIEYYVDGETTPRVTENSEAKYKIDDVISKTEIDRLGNEGTSKFDGYKYDHSDVTSLTMSPIEEENVVKLYYTKRDDLKYRVDYVYEDNSLNHSTTVENQVFGSTVTHTYMEELANTDLASHPGYVLDSITCHPGYVLDSITPEGNLTIANEKENLVNNVVTINYILRTDLSYVVKHEYEGHSELNSQDAAIENQTYGDEITEITKKELPGFEYVSHTPNPLKIGVGENIITAYYRLLHNLTYTIEYYVDEELKETETSDAVYSIDDKITSSEIATLGTNGASKFEGYKYDHSNVTELPINADVTKNVIKLYYTKRNDLSYVVKHEYEGHEELNSQDAAIENQTYGDEITEITKKELPGFEYVSHTPNPLKIGVGENIITAYYRLLHNLTYTIEYYVDEELKETETSDAVYSIDDKITSSEIATLGTNGASKFEGYKYDHSNVTELPINADVTKNVIKLYYTKRNDIKYRIEYYYDNKIDETLTKELEGTYLEQISEYTEKVKEGYVFAKVENVPLTLTTDEESNVIKVYYVTDGKGTVIEIPKTGIGYTNNSYELFSLLFILAISYFLKNKKVSE